MQRNRLSIPPLGRWSARQVFPQRQRPVEPELLQRHEDHDQPSHVRFLPHGNP